MTVIQRRRREKEARRSQILEAAREEFLEKGFEKTTIDDIARRSELSKGAIYLYFPSKEEIYISLMEEGSGILHNMLKEASFKDLPADTALRRLGAAYFRFYREYPNYFRMLFLYYCSEELPMKISIELHARCEEKAKNSLAIVAETIQRGVDEGLFRPCNPWDQAVLVWSAQNGIILLGDKGEPEHLNLNTSIERLHDLFMESTISALKSGR